jgi:hypothetical protein
MPVTISSEIVLQDLCVCNYLLPVGDGHDITSCPSFSKNVPVTISLEIVLQDLCVCNYLLPVGDGNDSTSCPSLSKNVPVTISLEIVLQDLYVCNYLLPVGDGHDITSCPSLTVRVGKGNVLPVEPVDSNSAGHVLVSSMHVPVTISLEIVLQDLWVCYYLLPVGDGHELYHLILLSRIHCTRANLTPSEKL